MKRNCFLQPSHCDGERIATLVKMSVRPSPPSQPLALGRHIFMHKYCPCDVYGETDTIEWEFHGPGTQAACPGRKPTDIRNGTDFLPKEKKNCFVPAVPGVAQISNFWMALLFTCSLFFWYRFYSRGHTTFHLPKAADILAQLACILLFCLSYGMMGRFIPVWQLLHFMLVQKLFNDD